MKNTYLLLATFFLLTNCSCSNDEPDTTEKELPPITMTGAGTFGCLVNGEVWLPDSDLNGWDRPELVAKFDETANYLIIQAEHVDLQQNIEEIINIYCVINGTGIFPMFHVSNSLFEINNVGYQLLPSELNEVEILYLNTQSNKISGTFNYTVIDSLDENNDTIHIADGRFDLNYTF